MSFRTIPLYPGDMYDTAYRLAAEHGSAPATVEPGPAWRQKLELGWLGVLVAETAGGAGATLQDLAAIVEGTGRAGLTVPLADRCGVAPVALAAADSAAAVALLGAVAAGTASVCPVLSAGIDGPGRAGAARLAADGSLHGLLGAADLSEPATHLLFTARDQGGEAALVLLPFDRVAAVARRYTGADGRQFADLTLDGIAVGPESVLLRGRPAAAAAAAACHAGALLGCVRVVGAIAAMIELTIDYLNTREQFGAALSSFQVLRHRVVEIYVLYENTAGLVRRLVEQAHETGFDGYPRDLAAARLYVGTVCRTVAEGVIQLHGGMGMTWEMLAARLGMQILGDSLRYGDAAECLDWLTAGSLAAAAA